LILAHATCFIFLNTVQFVCMCFGSTWDQTQGTVC
jgi:hypothetical protein